MDCHHADNIFQDLLLLSAVLGEVGVCRVTSQVGVMLSVRPVAGTGAPATTTSLWHVKVNK